MSMLMVLRAEATGMHLDAVAADVGQLADLGVSDVTVLRDGDSVAVVFQGWCLDARLEETAVRLMTSADGGSGLQVLHPVAHLAVISTGGGLP